MQDNKSNLNFGNKISETRKIKGLSQEALAEITSISLSTIQRIEKGTVSPRPFTLKVLAESLDLHLPDLIPTISDQLNSSADIKVLKKMNFVALIFALFPFFNFLVPLLIWKTSKSLKTQNGSAGRILSFQILWSVLTLIAYMTTIFLSNIITGQAGIGLYYSLITYMICVVLNMSVTIKISLSLSEGNSNFLPSVPNFF